MWQLTDEDGLSSNTIYNMTQDDKGYIWMGTSYGLCRYDGINFTPYTIPHYNDNDILHLRRDSFDRIWTINLSGQIACVDNNEVTKITPFQNKQVLDLRFQDSIMWIIFKDDQNAEFSQLLGLGHLSFDPLGNPLSEIIYNERYFKLSLTISDANPVQLIGQKYPRKKSSFIATPNPKKETVDIGFTIPHVPSRKVYKKDNKLQFINFLKNNLIEIDTNHQSKNLLDLTSMSALNGFSNFENHYMFPTKNGIYFKNKTQNEPTEHWMKNLTVNEIMQDREGNYWVSTDGRGLFVIPSIAFKHYATRSNELPNDNVYSLFYDNENKELYVGLDNGKVIIIKNAKVHKQIDLSVKGRVLSTLKVEDTFLYLTDTGLIRKSKDGKATKISNIAGKTILIENNKDLKAGTGLGLYSFPLKDVLSKKENIDYINKIEIKHRRIYALHKDKNETIWIGSTKGLLTFKDGIFQNFTENNKPLDLSFSSIVETSDQALWCGTSGKGLIKIKSDLITQRIDMTTGLSSNTVKNLLIHEDQLWVGTNKGINIIDLKTESIRYLDKYDGLPSDEITAIQIIDTTAWVGTSKGLVAFSKNLKKNISSPPPIHITGFKANEKNKHLDQSIHLDYNNNNIQIDYIGFAYSMRGDLQYKYKMNGADQDWVYTYNSTVRYPDLKPGEYTFDVIGINEGEIESLAPAKIHFKIAQPFWKTDRFILLIGIGLLSLFSIVYNIRSKQREQKRKEALDFQNTVNELRMQALQTQVNPHFIFNALNAIQQFQVSNNREQAIDYLTQFAHLIRMIFEHSKEKVITLNQEIEFLNLYLELEKLRFKDKVTIKFNISHELKTSQQLVNVPPLLIQPIIENAFKHGLFHKGHGGKLLIDFQKKEDFLICIIEDNGVGRVEAEKRNMNRNKNYESSGLSTSEKRLQIYNQSKNDAKNKENTYIKIVDLFNKQQQATGTRFELAIRI